MLGSKNGSRCSNCDVISDLVIVFTPQGKKGFCGPVCARKLRAKKNDVRGRI